MTGSPPKLAPFWWDDAGPPASPPSGAWADSADAVVVGAGLTGLSAAREMAGRGKQVVVLDAGPPGGGASSRNGGMLGGGHRLSPEELKRQYGSDMAVRLLREAHLDSLEFVKRLIREEEIACDFVECGRFRGAWTRRDYDSAGRALDRLKKIIPLEAEMTPKSRQHREVATDLYAGGATYFRHGGLNPAKFVAGMLRAAQQAGAAVFGNTPVAGVVRQREIFVVSTPLGKIRTGIVLVAVNGHASSQMAAQRRRVLPVPSFLAATAPLAGNAARELIPGGRMIVESRARHCYYRLSPDGSRLIFGARAAMTAGAPESFVRGQLGGLARQIFPSLGRAEFTHSWRGLTGFSSGMLPNVGRIDGVWHAMGYCGSGNAMAPWLGRKAALMMLGDSEGETAFSRTRFPAQWRNRGSFWFLPAAGAWLRLQDLRDNWRRNWERR